MALVPTPVTVVTAPADPTPAGATANAVASLSLEPPLMLVCLERTSRTLAAVRTSGLFAVNVLSGGSEDHARGFAAAAPHPEKWDGVAWSERSGSPVLDEALVWTACELRDLLDGGDHVIVTGLVLELGAKDDAPLVFHRGGYQALD